MAKELSTKTTGDIKDQVRKERNLMFLVAKILMAVATLVFGVMSIYQIFMSYQAAQDYDVQYGETSRQLSELKAQVEQWHEENDWKADAIADDGTNIEYRDMYSAYNDGIEVAALQNLYYQNKELRRDDRQRLNELTRSTDLWIGGGWDPVATPIRWDFVTWYDATDKTYDVCWECWHQAPSGTMYLIAIQFAKYDGETGTFRMSNAMYQTDFSRMLSSKGAVEAGDPVEMGPSPNAQAVRQMVDEMMGSNTAGEVPPDHDDNARFENNQNQGQDVLDDSDLAGGGY